LGFIIGSKKKAEIASSGSGPLSNRRGFSWEKFIRFFYPPALKAGDDPADRILKKTALACAKKV
jgi:hypothetical protein